jgi:hypothetical protein
MGKFVEEKAIIEKYLDNFVNQTYDYSRFIEGSPTFVTYYSKDILASTEDVTLGGITELVGTESPIKYNKIENFPLYGIDSALLPALEFDEQDGLNTTIEGEAIILPSTIKPLPNDYFVIGYYTDVYMFKISNVETDWTGNRNLYKVSYYLSGDKAQTLEERQVTENYKVVYENIGKEAKSVIKESDFLLLEKIDDGYDRLVKFYTKFYYNKSYNTFLYKDILYDNLLMDFINKNSLFIKTRTFLKNIKIEPLLKIDMDDFFNYDGSLFNAVEEKSKEQLLDFKFYSTYINDRTSIFNLFKNKYSVRVIKYGEDDVEEVFNVFPEDFITSIINNTPYDVTTQDGYEFFNFIIDYLNNSLVKENLTEYVNKEKFDLSLANYIIIPIILFVLKQIKKGILNN